MEFRFVSCIIVGFVLLLLTHRSAAVKCFECNSANNSACLDLNLPRMHSIVPVVDCGKTLPHVLSKQFFCRKITQTILHPEQTPEVRITRSCGWIKHKRACYTADNKDHLETVCQCFGDMCNSASTITNVKVAFLTATVAILTVCRNWRERNVI
ncbi:uncharacterized protein LOC114242399 isoform X1 [Bombyx mandarina]|uniref:Uncharacterized protein LOC114242399 isoform X1 n=1 Tax=Bombyx mandarina TaxID=7092 RepID=A0A6J2JJ78_BOMMA|nr:uncharacterized protein LOC114242399 isoform X1 [Bombyx mandarina]